MIFRALETKAFPDARSVGCGPQKYSPAAFNIVAYTYATCDRPPTAQNVRGWVLSWIDLLHYWYILTTSLK